MNLKQAQDTLGKHSYLEGTEHNGKYISMLAVVPSELQEMGVIIGRSMTNKSYDDILSKYSDFDVYVIFDSGIEDYLPDSLSSPELLSEFLKQV